MDADLIAYESMLAAKESAQWAYCGLWISFSAALATFLATAAGVIVLFSWRRQEALKDKKAFLFSVLKFQQTIGLGPKIYELTSDPVPDTHPFSKLTYALLQVYENALTMTRREDREKAKEVYLQLNEIYESLHQGKTESDSALMVLFQITADPFFEKF